MRAGAGGEERTPPCPGTGLRCAVGLSPLGRQRAQAGELGDGAGSWGAQTQPLGDQRGEKFISPSAAENVLSRKWLGEGDLIGEAGHRVLNAPLLPGGRNGRLNAGNDIRAMKTVLDGARDAESHRGSARWSRPR